MGTVYSNLDKQLLNLITATNESYRALYRKTDAQVLREMAEIWVQSGGDAGGLTDDYVRKLRTEIARVEKEAV